MFLHASWSHILGNMVFLAVFGKNVEDSFGHIRYLGFYIAGGFVAAMTQALFTLIGGSAADAAVPTLGASGAIAAVLGAYFVLYPNTPVLGLLVVFPVRIPAWVFLGFLVPVPARRGELRPVRRPRRRRGTAFFAHVGGFVFGLVARAYSRAPGPPARGRARRGGHCPLEPTRGAFGGEIPPSSRL